LLLLLAPRLLVPRLLLVLLVWLLLVQLLLEGQQCRAAAGQAHAA
jgi:hypothetical protein